MSDMKIAMVAFTGKVVYNGYSMTSLKATCVNLDTNEKLILNFTNKSKLFQKLFNMEFGGSKQKPFTELIRYNETNMNRVSAVTNPDKETMMKYSMYLI